MKKDNDRGIKDRLKDLLLDSAVILAIVSALSYLCAYIYEINFCNYFGIPTDLISISWTRFLQYTPLVIALIIVPLFVAIKPKGKYIICGILLVLILFCFSYLIGTITSSNLTILLIISLCFLFIIPNLISKFIIPIISKLQNSLLFWIVLTVSLVVVWILKLVLDIKITIHPLSFYMLMLILTILVLLELAVNWGHAAKIGEKAWFKTKIGWIKAKIAKSGMKQNYFAIGVFSVDSRRPDRVATSFIKRDRQTQFSLVIVVIVLVFLIPYTYKLLGSSEAAGEVVYSIRSFPQKPSIANLSVDELYKRNQNAWNLSQNLSEQNLIVLTVYGDKAICAPWYLDNGSGHYTITKEFVILPLVDITLTTEKIGPLQKPK